MEPAMVNLGAEGEGTKDLFSQSIAKLLDLDEATRNATLLNLKEQMEFKQSGGSKPAVTRTSPSSAQGSKTKSSHLATLYEVAEDEDCRDTTKQDSADNTQWQQDNTDNTPDPVDVPVTTVGVGEVAALAGSPMKLPLGRYADEQTADAEEDELRRMLLVERARQHKLDSERAAAQQGRQAAPDYLALAAAAQAAQANASLGLPATYSAADFGPTAAGSPYVQSMQPDWAHVQPRRATAAPWPGQVPERVQADPGNHAASDGNLTAVRALLRNLIETMPPEGTELAAEIMQEIQKQDGTNVQKTMDGIKALRWVKQKLLDVRSQAPATPANQELIGLVHARQRLHDMQEGLNRMCAFNDALISNQFPVNPVPTPNWQLAQAAQQAAAAATTMGVPTNWTPQMQAAHVAQRFRGPAHGDGALAAAAANFAAGSLQRRKDDPSSKGKFAAAAKMQRQMPFPADTGTLRSHLRDLQNVEIGHIFLVRRINVFGFKAPQILKSHFSQYGAVEKVLVAHSQVKSPSKGPTRVRPSGLGFIVMKSAEHVDGVLRQGEEQLVQGAKIRVQKFEHRTVDDGSLDDPETASW